MTAFMASPSFMQLALEEARAAAARGEVPIGCVIVRDGEVVARAGNRTLADKDPTGHAELIAIREAAATIGTERLTGCDLYVTLEPCTMCAAALSFARIRRLYFGASCRIDKKFRAPWKKTVYRHCFHLIDTESHATLTHLLANGSIHELLGWLSQPTRAAMEAA